MPINDNISVEIYRKLLRRAAWRIQYKTRTQHIRESCPLYDNYTYDNSFEAAVLSEIYVRELLNLIPWEKCRYIIEKIVIEDMTEKDIAFELKITQQGVSKWKRKGLEIIKEYLNNSTKL